MGGAHLGADAGLALGDDGVEEADDVDAFVEQGAGELLGELCVVQHDRDNRMIAGTQVESGCVHAFPEVAGIGFDAIAQDVGSREDLEDLDAGGDQRRWQGIGEQVRARALAQQVDDFATAGGKAAGAAAERLAQSRRVDVDLIHHAVQFGGAASVLADKAGRVGIIHHQQGVVFFLQRDDFVELGDIAIHREHAIGGDQARALVLRLDQVLFQFAHVAVGIAATLGLAEADAVDDRGMVERVGNHCVLFGKDGLEQAAVGVEAAGVEDGVVGAEEFGNPPFQLLVQVLGAADETHAGESESVRVECLFRGLDHFGVVGQSQIVVCTEIQDLAAIGSANGRRLRRGDDALGLEQALFADGFKFAGKAVAGCGVHGSFFGQRSVVSPKVVPTPTCRPCCGRRRADRRSASAVCMGAGKAKSAGPSRPW